MALPRVEGKQMIICNQCDDNNYIKVREIWKDTSQTKKVWITKPCPKCVPITEQDLDSIDMITSDMTLEDYVKKINKELKN